MRRARSGSHLIKRGQIYHYRRVVPKTYRRAFGVTEVTMSLETSSETEAKRLEKEQDVLFERRLLAANPETRTAHLASKITRSPSHSMAQWAVAMLPPEDREPVRALVEPHYAARAIHGNNVASIVDEIANMLYPLSPEQVERCRTTLFAVVRNQSTPASLRDGALNAAMPVPDGIHTLEYAYSRWLRTKNEDRDAGTIGMGRRHLNAFIEHSKLILLGEVRRSHFVAWRDHLIDEKFAANSINQRLNLVAAIIRTGWRDAEMAEQTLKAIALSDDDDNDRSAWERDEILKALRVLEPHSWSAWLYLICLTTSVRMGEPMAARVRWFDPRTNMIEVNERRYTKGKKKLHCMPIILCLREPFIRYIGNRSPDDYLLREAPRPGSPNLGISHEASKWFGRFFQKHEINRVFHELRDTWIEAAKHSTVEKDIWEIISGHSKATMSDRYGGKKPDILSRSNQTVCKFLTDDAEINAAMMALVA